MFEWFKSKIKEDFIEVEGDRFNPIEQLVIAYREQALRDKETINDLKKQVSDLSMTVIDLNTKLSSVPRINPPVIKHFNTVAALKYELEARSRAQMLKDKDDKDIAG